MPNGGSPSLVFSGKFKKRPVEDQLEYLEKLCASQNEALDQMQQERNTWREQALKLQQAVVNAEQAFEIQKKIAADMIHQHNEEGARTAQDIATLEHEIRQRGG